MVVGVVGVRIDGLVGREFGEEVRILQERFALGEGHGFDAGDHGVGDGNLGPVGRGFGDDLAGDE